MRVMTKKYQICPILLIIKMMNQNGFFRVFSHARDRCFLTSEYDTD